MAAVAALPRLLPAALIAAIAALPRRFPAALIVAIAVLPLACTPIGGRQPDEPPSGEQPAPRGEDESEALFTFYPDLAPVAIGSAVPEVELEDADGRPFRLAEHRGTALVVTFFESRSPDPGLCPEILQRLVELHATMRPELLAAVKLLAVSVDPVFDTAEVLRAHATGIGATGDRWLFLRGDPEAVARFAGGFGVVMWRRADGSVGHTLNTLLIDPDGRLADQFPGLDGWSTTDLLAAVSAAAR
jgi:cytochrome oxidase Cu insertion factor (SCO1/SenC/PrrC family)